MRPFKKSEKKNVKTIFVWDMSQKDFGWSEISKGMCHKHQILCFFKMKRLCSSKNPNGIWISRSKGKKVRETIKCQMYL